MHSQLHAPTTAWVRPTHGGRNTLAHPSSTPTAALRLRAAKYQFNYTHSCGTVASAPDPIDSHANDHKDTKHRLSQRSGMSLGTCARRVGSVSHIAV